MKISYTWIIIIIIVIFIINKNLNKRKINPTIDTGGDVNKVPLSPLENKIKETVQKLNELSPLKVDSLTDEKEPVTIISNGYNQIINEKPLNQKKDFISPNPEGSTEYRFVEETPKTAWSTIDVSQHPQYYTSNFKDEKTDTSGFFNEDQFFHDNTSPHVQTNLPDRCSVNNNNEVTCNYNNKLQIVPPRLINDPDNNLVLNSIGQGGGDIFKTIDAHRVSTINGNTYQVWEYENEKSINGGQYLNNITGSNPVNEDYMEIKFSKDNSSF